ncbi:phage minor head protein [Xenorhabdus ehlersii]|uniref:Phage Mu F like family protein n=1 Tax=Xenorhabdus ehlersii TaxID=290111 RepID=A0A2D0IKD6_9GAMM|nr:phage minor head protein [Xenorhabdus ehlersii]PHM22228.1 phage Mu F like family protein [Xenorhabdus ehlersii]RKE90572.1 phage Mu protein F like protein [Xenorhabdus ehlersii]
MKSINEMIMDELIAHSLFSGRYSTGVARRMVKALNEFDAELTASLIVALDDANIDTDSFTMRRLESLLFGVRAINKNAVESAFSVLSREMLEHAHYEIGYYPSLFGSLLPDAILRQYPLVGITEEMLYSSVMARPFQGKLLSEWADGLEKDRMARISNTVRNGYLNGESAVEIGRKIRGHANQGYKDGSLQMSRANATTIAKTAVSHLQAVAREQFVDANRDILDCKRWVSTLDNKTSNDCIVRDGLRYTLDGKPIGHKVPYLQGPGKIHFNCRSMETLVVKSWRELGIDADEMSEGMRASMDGQVPAGATFLEWIQRQPEWRQRQVFGETRFRLMKDGGIHPSQFYTDKGEFISLDKLKEIDEQAFREAGYD